MTQLERVKSLLRKHVNLSSVLNFYIKTPWGWRDGFVRKLLSMPESLSMIPKAHA